MKKLWNFYVDSLQGHPTRCNTPKAFTEIQLLEDIQDYFQWRDATVLVIGCADGREVHLFKKLGYKKVVGITMGDINVRAASVDYPDANVIAMDMHNLSKLGNEVFDYIYLNQTFEHAFAPFIFCLELWAATKVGGSVYIKYPSHKAEGLSQLTDPMTALTSHHHPNMLRLSDAVQLLKVTGFKITAAVPGGNNIVVVQKLGLNSLLNAGVHPDVIRTLNKRLILNTEE